MPLNGTVDLVIPVIIQERPLFDMFLSNLATFRSDRIGTVRVVCNRWRLFDDPVELHDQIAQHTPYPVSLVTDKERSVAGAWNKGIHDAMGCGIERFVITAMDVECMNGSIDHLCEFAEREGLDLCHANGNGFNLFTVSQATIEKIGWFDREFKPAYYEDNDYSVRVEKAGGEQADAPECKINHFGSGTIKMDAEMAHHVKHWFDRNQERLIRKWGFHHRALEDIAKCYDTPFDAGKAVSWWPEQDVDRYDPWGGIHE
ncbi:MAG: hypothetical protein O3A51_07160 [Verrucomicrobia bacterium]|nr:hypothetical protein [Verrucomicrobiota bacterium]